MLTKQNFGGSGARIPLRAVLAVIPVGRDEGEETAKSRRRRENDGQGR